jgi:hypothetical protein
MEKSNSQANDASLSVRVEDFLIFGRRFFGDGFGEFGCARILAIVSLPLVLVRRRGRRRRNGVSRVRLI